MPAPGMRRVVREVEVEEPVEPRKLLRVEHHLLRDGDEIVDEDITGLENGVDDDGTPYTLVTRVVRELVTPVDAKSAGRISDAELKMAQTKKGPTRGRGSRKADSETKS